MALDIEKKVKNQPQQKTKKGEFLALRFSPNFQLFMEFQLRKNVELSKCQKNNHITFFHYVIFFRFARIGALIDSL